MKKRMGILSLIAMLTMTSCSSVNFSVDNLFAAPKLTEEQGEIHEALISAVGNNINLKYPKNGDYRSAYVIANLDNDETDEALVFYEYTGTASEDNGLRVNILDKDENGNWYSVKEIAGAGTEVDQVIISTMGDSDKIDVLIGYQTIASEDKTLEIYKYENNDFTRIGTDTYSVLEAFDINNDGYNELVTIQRNVNAESGQVLSKASVLNVKNGEISRGESIDMSDAVTSYISATTGKVGNGNYGIYIDGVTANGDWQTEIVYYRYSKLQNPMQAMPSKLLPLCTRPAGYYSEDIDDDGVVEIPTTKPMMGYENAVAEEQLLLTTWSVYKDFYSLEAKYSGYYSIYDGYALMFPSRWTDEVTVKRDTDSNEVVFYKYEGNINDYMTELMRIAVVSRNDTQDYTYDGYELIESRGQLDYLVKLPTNKREKLILTIDEVQNNFYKIDY